MEHIISSEDRNKWVSLLDQLITDWPDYSDRELVKAAADIASQVLGNKRQYEEEINQGSGFVLLRGCPIEATAAFPPTQNSNILSHSKLSVLGISNWLGFNPFGFRQEKFGHFVHEIIPLKEKTTSVSSNGYVEFRPHADGAYLPRELRPETLSLICLNNDSGTDTRLVTIDNILSTMEKDEIQALMSPNYIHVPPETFEVNRKHCHNTSIVDSIDGRWEVKVALHNSKALNSDAEKALSRFSQLASTLGTSISWKPGDILIFSNRRCLHGRGDIDGTRWLRRCYGSRGVEPCSVIDLAS